ncbi:PadR family transcriptional regulator AphA [Catenulispora sp. GP43]|uniref:PadR family transcriptional regulator n=1 Tax=Catenulispora sp. GP43 TaxID=3156263 RepID=UPI003512DDB9
MSLRHALLGLLREQPASGYDLMQVFNASLHNIWPATQSQVYSELNKLAAAGLLTASAEGPRGRKEYALTEAGHAELQHWLLEVETDVHPRSEGLLKVFLLGAVSREQATGFLAWLGEMADKDVAAMTELESSIEWEDEDLHVYGRLVLEFAKRMAAMSREWSDWAVEQIARSDSRILDGPPSEG